MRAVEKVLVANRGEIARRVLRSVHALGLRSVAVYSDADAEAPHVCEADEAVRLGPAPAAESYLNIDRIIDAARRVGADAVHPGYGFLSENPDFAERCAAAGLLFIGPSAEAIRAMGSKIEAKEIARRAGVPVVPGFSLSGLSDEAVMERAAGLGYPLLIKAAAGGGGRGMRLVARSEELLESLASARREAMSAFGDDTLLVERLVERPRHVEVQVLGDCHGRVIHLFERECSVQRRHQKVIEEAPSPAVDEELRERLGEAAVRVAQAVGYSGAGTVEFVLDPEASFFFLEMNTRLQVEHPVTEAITGLDLVGLQIRLAAGEPLPLEQAEVPRYGHAIEARLYAEDPARDFAPATGRLVLWNEPQLEGVRIDSGVEAGSEIGVYYDPMLAKIIAWGQSREEARRRLAAALERFAIGGVTTNRDFLVAAIRHPEFRAGRTDTGFIERHFPAAVRARRLPEAGRRRVALAAVVFDHARRRGRIGPLPPGIPPAWRNNPWRPQAQQAQVEGSTVTVCYQVARDGGLSVSVEEGGRTASYQVRVLASDAESIALEIDGVRRTWRVSCEGDRRFLHGPDGGAEVVIAPRFPSGAAESVAGGCVAPMTGIIRRVCVGPGDRVQEGDLLLVLEAMKMEHRVVAQAAGVVREVRVREGQMVDPDEVLVIVEPED